MKYAFACATVCALLAAGCSLLPPEERPLAARMLTEGETRVVASAGQFGLDLFGAVNAETPGDNVFVSPLSVSMALGMLRNGAAGETRAAVEQALRQSGLTEEEINDAYRSLIDLLSGLDPEVTFEIANAIWYREGFQVEPAYLDVNRKAFDAEVRPLDFTDAGAVPAINGWVDDKTHGKIDEIVESLDQELVMLLVNALYFKGSWRQRFEKRDTQERPFTRLDGGTSRLPMMAQTATHAYYADDDVEVVDLAYGDSLYSMTVVLPRPGKDVNDVVAAMDADRWAAWTGGLRPQNVDLQLPRFKLEYKTELSEVLAGMGMGLAFACGLADFTRIARGAGLCVSFVLHKTFVEVNEEGTEAAAVTAIGIEATSVGGGGAAPFHVDRPFVFALRERHSGTLLFVGKVARL